MEKYSSAPFEYIGDEKGNKRQVSLIEFKILCSDLELSEEEIIKTFVELDTDRDGMINIEDLEHGFNKVYTSTKSRGTSEINENLSVDDKNQQRQKQRNETGKQMLLTSSSASENKNDEPTINMGSPTSSISENKTEMKGIMKTTAVRRVLPLPEFDPSNRELLDVNSNSKIDSCFTHAGETQGEDLFCEASELNVETVYDSESVEHKELLGCTELTSEQIKCLCKRSQEQICEFYQQLHASDSPDLLNQCESILLGVIKDVRQQQLENKGLEQSFKREKEYNERHLRHLEEELENQMQKVATRVRFEENEKYTIEVTEIKSQYSQEIEQLRENLQKLQNLEIVKSTTPDKINEEQISTIKNKLESLTQENRYLKSELTDEQTNLAIVRSELATLRQEYVDKDAELDSEKKNLYDYVKEQENLRGQIHKLHDANKKLHDTNDDLRTALEASRQAFSRATSARNSVSSIQSATEGITRRQATSVNSSLAEEINQSERFSSPDGHRRSTLLPSQESCEVDSLPEDFDSGHSTLRDINEFDSDEENHFRPLRRLKRGGGHSADSEETDAEIENALQRSSYLEDIPRSKRRRERGSSRPESSCSRTSSRSSVFRGATASPRCISPEEPMPLINGDPERMYKVVLAGDAAVGKSSFIMRLCKGRFIANINSTLGVDFQTKTVEVDGRVIALQLWDTAGQERFRSIAKSYFRRADGVLLLYDCTYERSFTNVREWIDAIEDGAQKKLPIMMCANKTDLREAAAKEGRTIVSRQEGSKLAKDYSALFIETSAKDGKNVASAVTELARLLRTNEDLEVKSVGLQLHEMQIESSNKFTKCCST